MEYLLVVEMGVEDTCSPWLHRHRPDVFRQYAWEQRELSERELLFVVGTLREILDFGREHLPESVDFIMDSAVYIQGEESDTDDLYNEVDDHSDDNHDDMDCCEAGDPWSLSWCTAESRAE